MTAPGLATTISTERLRLPLITPEEADDMRAGRRHPSWDPDFPREDDLDGIGMLKPPVEGSADHTWGSRLLVRRVDGLVFGTIGFFGPPDAAGDDVLEAEVGYGMVASARGHGAATEALRAMVAAAEAVGVRVRASVLPDNAASLRVLAKCGFTDLRGTSEDGELVMVRPAPPA